MTTASGATGSGTGVGDGTAELAKAVAALTDLVSRLQPPGTTPPSPEARRSSFGYDVLAALLARQKRNGDAIDVPFVDVTRHPGRLQFDFPTPRTRGSHAELRGGRSARGGDLSAASIVEVVPIEHDTARTTIGDDREIESVLVLDGETGPIVAIGPRVPALTPRQPGPAAAAASHP